MYDIQKGSPEWKIYTSGGDYSEAVSRALLMKNEESPEKREMEEEINDYNVEEDLKLAEMKKKKKKCLRNIRKRGSEFYREWLPNQKASRMPMKMMMNV